LSRSDAGHKSARPVAAPLRGREAEVIYAGLMEERLTPHSRAGKHTHTHTCINTQPPQHTCPTSHPTHTRRKAHTHSHTHTHTHTHTHMHKQTHTHTHTHCVRWKSPCPSESFHTQTHTHTHTHTHTTLTHTACAARAHVCA